jgi:excisionase family DNA binding protein
MTQLPPLLTAGQVAKRFATSTDTVRRWAREGRIPSVTLPSGRTVYRREEIDAIAPLTAEQVAELEVSA